MPHFHLRRFPLALLALALATSAGGAEPLTQQWQTEQHINENNSLDIVNTIVQSGCKQTAPLVFSLPLVYKDKNGKTVSEQIDIKNVTDAAGKRLDYKVEKGPEAITLKVVPPGGERCTLVIGYNLRGAVELSKEGSELFVKVIGTDWPYPVALAKALFYLPVGTDLFKVHPAAFRGSDRKGSAQAFIASDGIFIEADNLRPHEGFACYLHLPPGSVKPFTAKRKVSLALSGVWPILSAWWPILAIPLVVSILLYLAFWRDRQESTGFDAPGRWLPAEESSPGEMRLLRLGQFDRRAAFSSLLSLCERGFLRIEEMPERDFVFSRCEPPVSKPLQEHERCLLEALFRDGPSPSLFELKMRLASALEASAAAAIVDLTGKRMIYAQPAVVAKNVMILAGVFIAAALWLVLLQNHALGAGMALAGVILLVGKSAVPFRTVDGAKLAGHAKSLEQLLQAGSAEAMASIAGKRPGIFYQLLPFAYALDSEKQWCKLLDQIPSVVPSCYELLADSGDKLSNLLLLAKLSEILSGLEG